MGPVLFGYDGSELARLAIEEAGKLLAPGHDALIVTVWTTFDVGFVVAADFRLNAAAAGQVKKAAQDTAADGAALAEAVGFRVRSVAIQAAPRWKGIVEPADDRDASLIVLGCRGRGTLVDVLFGSVAREVETHTRRPVLIFSRRS